MKEGKIKNSELKKAIVTDAPNFPKYTTQLMNLANQNSQATRPKYVGQMTELIKEFDGNSLEEWRKWYNQKHPDAIDKATQKIAEMIDKLSEAMQQIDEEMIRAWVEELIIANTYSGLNFQEAILKKIAESKNKPFSPATPQDESKGIDGYIGDKPISIKPTSYRVKKGLTEQIDVDIVYYEKLKTCIKFKYDF
ncbi:restriction endonuclease [Aliifodinibius salipaludis]|uniref:Restriction endonuclease n=1 Tax=Fodinibius salipaludis TaxID=2032627 RepID=A0A2A2G732_9BACT|nr:MjaI family restriction endonuclease [Aliifodinibius salipaludis]PAU93441.1 restriction endonuclease [Aliifodinibius salipaludis]